MWGRREVSVGSACTPSATVPEPLHLPPQSLLKGGLRIVSKQLPRFRDVRESNRHIAGLLGLPIDLRTAPGGALDRTNHFQEANGTGVPQIENVVASLMLN